MAEWLGKGLQNPVPRFDSGCRLSEGRSRAPRLLRAISSGGERFLDAEEVSGSNPLSPTLESPAKPNKTGAPGFLAGGLVHQPCSNAASIAYFKASSRARTALSRIVGRTWE